MGRKMRRFARVAVICCVCGLCSVMYTFTQIIMSLEPKSRLEGHDKIAKQLKRDASLLVPSIPKVETMEGLEQEQRWLQSRFETNKTDVKRSPDKWIHLAVVACGERFEETVTMLKSSILFNVKPIQFHIFADDELHPKFKNILNSWPFQQKFHYILYPITFPSENAAEWKKLFKPCASQRLFLPLVLKDVDALLYVDTDILFLRPVDDIWSFFKYFNSTQIAAMAPEHEEPRIGWYNRFARHPYYGSTGVNSGVMLMNMTRIRRKYFKNDMTTARLQWGEMLMPLLKKYKFNITWGDQDLLNIVFYHNPVHIWR